MINSHYVPRLILRKFSDKLCLYNVKTGELNENIVLENAYAIEDYYDSETEKKLNLKIESQFGNLLANYILKCEGEISLSRKQLFLVKKFLLLSVLRSIHGEAFMQVEKRFYENLQNKAKRNCAIQGIEYDAEAFAPPFEEKQIPGETTFDYWMRTLNVILDTDGTPQGIMEHPNKTYPAYRWACIINDAYLAFWDAPDDRDEFVITDIGMTSENEKGWDGILVHNQKKLNCLIAELEKEGNKDRQIELARLMHVTSSFHENFQMFPISSKRMIVLIAPFYKYRYMQKSMGISVPPLDFLTCIPNEALFEPNRNYYKLPQNPANGFKYHEDDRYIYDVKTLSSSEIRYCNALFLDRIDTYLGFSSLEHAVGSIIKYKKLNDPPYTPRVDYTSLYRIIQDRYLGSLNV